MSFKGLLTEGSREQYDARLMKDALLIDAKAEMKKQSSGKTQKVKAAKAAKAAKADKPSKLSSPAQATVKQKGKTVQSQEFTKTATAKDNTSTTTSSMATVDKPVKSSSSNDKLPQTDCKLDQPVERMESTSTSSKQQPTHAHDDDAYKALNQQKELIGKWEKLMKTSLNEMYV